MLRKITDYKHDYHSFMGAYAKFINARNIVEIGVQNGDCATFLVDAVTINGGKYYGYDIWESIGVYNSDNVDVDDIRHKLIMEGYNSNFYKLTKINTHSEEFKDVLYNDTNGVIDFAFIDGDHSYEGVKRDFETIYPMLSEEGSIAFHDTYSHAGCRKFVLDLYEKYNDGTFDIINLPYGGGHARFGLTILVKRSYPIYRSGITNVNHEFEKLSADDIYDAENDWLNK
jgi:predicted O-methyltransferase YrrM